MKAYSHWNSLGNIIRSVLSCIGEGFMAFLAYIECLIEHR